MLRVAEAAVNYEGGPDKSKDTIPNSSRGDARGKDIWELKSNKDTADLYSNNKDRSLGRAAQRNRD